MPHKHSPKSKHSQAKKERYKLIREYRFLPKIWDHECFELISLEDSEHFVKGEVLISQKSGKSSLTKYQRQVRDKTQAIGRKYEIYRCE